MANGGVPHVGITETGGRRRKRGGQRRGAGDGHAEGLSYFCRERRWTISRDNSGRHVLRTEQYSETWPGARSPEESMDYRII